MTYDALGVGALDYLPCRYGTSKLLFRGPKRKLNGDYIAFIGGTETYGKFIEQPFPNLIEQAMGLKCANFGFPNAGLDVFLHDPFVPVAATGARVTIIQIMGAQNMSNRFYSVHPRRNDRFVKASEMLQAIYGDVDFTDCHFNKHLLTTLRQVSSERFALVRQELQQSWVARMKLLLSKIQGKTILLWFGRLGPDQNCEDREFGTDPMFVTRDMIEALHPAYSEFVEVVASAAAQSQGNKGMIFAQMEAPAAGNIMGPAAHEEVVEALQQAIARHI
jgi:hypothetical protein